MNTAEQYQHTEHAYGDHILIMEHVLSGRLKVMSRPRADVWKMCDAHDLPETVREIEKLAGLRAKPAQVKRKKAKDSRLQAMDGKPTSARLSHGRVYESSAAVDGEIISVWKTGGRDWIKTAKSKGWLSSAQYDTAMEFDEIFTDCANAESIRSGLDPDTVLMKIIQGASTKNATGLNDGPLHAIGVMKRYQAKIGAAGIRFLVGVICDGKQPGVMVPVMTGKSTDADNKIGLGFLRHLLNEVG